MTRAAGIPALPVARTLEALAPRILPPADSARHNESAPLPVAPTTPAAEPLPVARFADHAQPSTVDAKSAAHQDSLPPIVQREPVPEPAPAAQPAADHAAVPPETEELVKKLFDPLLRRLKTELRLDRERRGALTDRSH